jgi:tRNA(Ile)-lysidine synthase
MTIAKNAEFLREDCDFLETEAREAFFECATRGIAGQVRNDGVDDIIGLQIAKLTALHPAISRRVIRLVISKINSEAFTNITSAHIEIVRQLIHSQTGSEVHLPGVIAAKEYRQLIFFSPAKKTLQKFFYELKDSSSFIPEINKTVTVSYSVSEPQKPYAKCFCCDKINVNAQPLVLRTRRAGDRISLKNAAGIIFTKKIQDYFTDEKIPKSQRDSVPLLAYGDEILWIMAGKNRVNAKYESKQGIWVTIQ